MEDTKPLCPFCQSSLTVRLGNETHCNSCGRSWGLDRNPVATQAADRKRAASASTGFYPHQHECEGLSAIEAEYNQAEAALREASRNVLCCKNGLELLPLRQIERKAREERDRLLQIRAERLAHKAAASWPQAAK
jgi:hypothetical protein